MVKYGQEDLGWRTKKTNGAFGVGVWKEILKKKIGVGKIWLLLWGMVPKSYFELIFGVVV